MKITLLAVCIFCAVTALGQSSVGGSSMASSFQVADHPAHASQQPAATEQSLLGNNSVTSAHGEMPLWEAVPERHSAPLGDQARVLKKEHATVKQSRFVWVN
jgi:hypothetical protein